MLQDYPVRGFTSSILPPLEFKPGFYMNPNMYAAWVQVLGILRNTQAVLNWAGRARESLLVLGQTSFVEAFAKPGSPSA